MYKAEVTAARAPGGERLPTHTPTYTTLPSLHTTYTHALHTASPLPPTPHRPTTTTHALLPPHTTCHTRWRHAHTLFAAACHLPTRVHFCMTCGLLLLYTLPPSARTTLPTACYTATFTYHRACPTPAVPPTPTNGRRTPAPLTAYHTPLPRTNTVGVVAILPARTTLNHYHLQRTTSTYMALFPLLHWRCLFAEPHNVFLRDMTWQDGVWGGQADAGIDSVARDG